MTTHKKFTLVILLLMLFPAFYNRTFADGCFFYDVQIIGNSAESPNQRALVIHDGEKETLFLQVKYSGNVENLAWVIPLPCLPEENGIVTASDSIFEELHDQTQPRVYRIIKNKSLGSRNGGYDEDQTEIPFSEGVQVWEMLNVGPYDVTVLSGSSSQALIDWLQSRNYHFPENAHSTVDFYIQKNWYFVATRVNVASTSEKNSTYQAGLPALQMTFQTEKPVFPLRISELTAAQENEIELYVAAEHRMVCQEYQTAAMDRNEVQKRIEEQIANNKRPSTGIVCACRRLIDPAIPQPEYDYEKIFRDKIASFDEPTFVVEYAASKHTSYDPIEYPNYGSFQGFFNDYFGPNSEFWLTRFRSLLPPSSMQEDVTFIPDPQGDEWLSLRIYLEDRNPHPWFAHALGWSGLFLLPLFSFKKIRKNHWRVLTLFVILIFIALA